MEFKFFRRMTAKEFERDYENWRNNFKFFHYGKDKSIYRSYNGKSELTFWNNGFIDIAIREESESFIIPPLIRTCEICYRRFTSWIYIVICLDCQINIIELRNKTIKEIRRKRQENK